MSKIEAEVVQLRREVHALKALLAAHGIELPLSPDAEAAARAAPASSAGPLSKEAKVKLFRRLFQGREDVYPVRWQSQNTGKSGYSPACANLWRPVVCKKNQGMDCNVCSHRLYPPVTDDVITRHLEGKITAGVYPVFGDDKCYFLAIDFDDEDWRDDARAVLQTCTQNNLPAALEISRSGEGAHLWLFFANPTPARDVRRLGSALISATCARTRQLKLSSYDRLFPNQDTVPKGGFGNLIALPLQQEPRKLGRSVFVDENLQALADHCEFLENIIPLPQERLELALTKLVGDRHPLDVAYAEVPEENEDTPWIRAKPDIKVPGVMPKAVCATMGNQLFIEKAGMPQSLMNRLIRLAAFQNPEFYKQQAMRMSTWKIPRIIGCAEDRAKYLVLPRGCLGDVRSLLTANKIDLRLEDARSMGKPLKAEFKGILRPDQQEALDVMLAHDVGTLIAPTAFGKTVTAAALIARRKVSTLVIVHRGDLMRQWKERLGSFLELNGQKIGVIGAGKKKPTGMLDIAVIQSLVRRDDLPELFGHYGQIIADEAHHLSAPSFEAAIKEGRSRYVIGLTATPIRSNGHHPIVFMQCGPIRHVAKRPTHVPKELVVHVGQLPTPPIPPHASIQEVIRLLAEDSNRNARIVADAITALNAGRKVLLLTKRTEHLDLLYELLKDIPQPRFLLHGRMKTKERQVVIEAMAALEDDAPHILLASAQLVGEGFDHAPLDTLILTLPISWEGTLQQYAGRLHREHSSKTEILIHDYVELDNPQLSRMWEKRQRGYRAMGYRVETNQFQPAVGQQAELMGMKN
ncbi:MAG: DEAD/DEAH box helicase family protein [Telluria sp.]